MTVDPSLAEAVDQLFLIYCGSLVFMFQVGFAFLCGGLIQSKNVVNIMIKNLLDATVGAILYWLVGFGLAYGKGDVGPLGSFAGTTAFLLDGVPKNQLANFWFQYTFCATAATIVSGALAERVNFYAYICYCVALTGVIYPIATHWVWTDDGWLHRLGFLDFAGSGVVHGVGGVASIVGVIFLGPRIGRFAYETGANGKKRRIVVGMPRHNIPFVVLGTFVFFFGFIGFNGGSQMHLSGAFDGGIFVRDASIVVEVIVNTFLAGSSGTLAALLLSAAASRFHQYSLVQASCGALGGMVAVCSGVNGYTQWAALVVGGVGGVCTLVWSHLMVWMGLDDPVDAVAVHFGAGAWGVLSVGLFHNEKGLLFGAGGRQLGLQVLGLCSLIAWVVATCVPVFLGLRFLGILRVHADLEEGGLDHKFHGESAYTYTFDGNATGGGKTVTDAGGAAGTLPTFYKRRGEEKETPSVTGGTAIMDEKGTEKGGREEETEGCDAILPAGRGSGVLEPGAEGECASRGRETGTETAALPV